MDSQKGSVKDRIRARFRFLQYKKLKKKQEQQFLKHKKMLEKERIKAEQIRLYGRSYNKIQVFSYTLLGLFIGFFTPKSSPSKIKKELEEIQNKFNDIVMSLEQDHDIQIVYDKIDNTYQQLDDLKKKYKIRLVADNFNPSKEISVLKTIDQKQKELQVFNEVCHKRENQNNNNVKNEYKRVNKTKESMGATSTLENDSLTREKESIVLNSELDLNPLKIVKKMNEDLKEYDKELERIEETMRVQDTYAGLYDCEFKFKQLKMRISKILEEYELLEEKFDLEELEEIIDIDVIDKYELRKDEKKIVQRITRCETLLDEIERRKADISTSSKSKNLNSNETKEGKKQEKIPIKKETDSSKKEQEREKLEEQFDDIYLANRIIVDQIAKEKRMIDKLNRQLYHQPAVVRKRSVFFYVKKFTTSILNFGFSFLPFKYFKSRMLGALVSGVMLNNSIRSVRRIFTPRGQEISYLVYNDMLKQIRTNQDYVYHLTNICYDSLTQISEIKDHLHLHYSISREYDAPLTEFYSELEQLELKLNTQLKDLERTNANYEVIKQKVKVREYM